MSEGSIVRRGISLAGWRNQQSQFACRPCAFSGFDPKIRTTTNTLLQAHLNITMAHEHGMISSPFNPTQPNQMLTLSQPTPLFPTSTLHPCIAELLRTQHARPTLTLRISKILITTLGKHKQAYRLLLTDDEIVIQAVLKAEIHRFVITGEVGEGDVILVERYELRKGARVNGEGEIWYLGVRNFRPAFPATDLATMKQGMAVTDHQDGEDTHEYGLNERSPKGRRIDADSSRIMWSSQTGLDANRSKDDEVRKTHDGEDSEDSDDAFESTAVNPQDLDRRRQTLRELTQNNQILPPQTESDSPKVMRHVDHEYEDESVDPGSDLNREEDHPRLGDVSLPAKQQAIPTDITLAKNSSKSITHPLNLVTLSDLYRRSRELSRPMRRNYICDVFAVVSYVSPDLISRPKLPPQRDIRILDPTSADNSHPQGILLTVLTEAKSFIPEVGTVGLFRRVRTHEWEGCSLKAYEVDCKGREWFVTDSGMLRELGLDEEGMRSWWEERYNVPETENP
jgi:hypothetical protein